MEPKKYIRNFTEEAREKQKQHLSEIRQKAMEKKREMKEITLKAKLMKLEPKIELAKKYDEYINNKISQPPQEKEIEPEEEIIEIPKPRSKPKKKIIYQEVEEEEEEEIVYVKKNKPVKPQQESLDKTLYKSSQEILHNRIIEERIRANLVGFHNALMPREY